MRLNFNNVGKGLSAIADSYTTRQKRKDLESIGPDSEAVEGQGYEITAPDGTVSTGVLGKDANADIDAIKQNYGEAGYGMKLMDKPQYASRSGSKDTGTFDTKVDAEKVAGKDNYGLMRQRAAVYEKYGDTDTANRMRTEARNAKREDARDVIAQNQEARAAESHKQGIELGGINIDNAKYAKQQREAQDSFSAAISEAKANNANLNASQLMQIATQYGLNQEGAQKAILGSYGQDEAQYKHDTDMRVQAAMTAAAKGGLTGLINLYNTDSLFNNGGKFEVSAPNAKGLVSIIHKDKEGNVISTSPPTTESAAMAYAIAVLKDPTAAFKLHMDVADHESKIKLQAAQAHHAQKSGDLAAAQALAQPELAQAKIDVAKANAETARIKAENAGNNKEGDLKRLKYGTEQMQLMFGVKVDPISGKIDGTLADKAAYANALRELESRVNRGEQPAAAFASIYDKVRRDTAMDKVKGAKPSGAVDMMRNKFGY